MLVTSENWWAKTEWTDEHYKLARRLMRGIHVLPPDCGDDVVQEVAMRYSKARNAGKGGNYEALAADDVVSPGHRYASKGTLQKR